MTRSYSRIDKTPTRGYQDIMLFLALEDVQNFAAVRTKLMSGPSSIGDRLRFFVGMAHIKTLRSNRLAVLSSQVEINADITSSYVYTTKTSTDFTFIKDVQVSLSEVKRPTSDNNVPTAKFATITLIVPDTLTSADAVNIIPLLALHVEVGFRANSATQAVYPCTQTYSGAAKFSTPCCWSRATARCRTPFAAHRVLCLLVPVAASNSHFPWKIRRGITRC